MSLVWWPLCSRLVGELWPLLPGVLMPDVLLPWSTMNAPLTLILTDPGCVIAVSISAVVVAVLGRPVCDSAVPEVADVLAGPCPSSGLVGSGSAASAW
jgi:hypothetical protein